MINILVCDDDMEFAVLEKGVIDNAFKRYEQEVWTDFYKSWDFKRRDRVRGSKTIN